MLGFVASRRDVDCIVSRFVPDTPFRPRRAARHGRVLLTTTPYFPAESINLEVWDPVTDELREVPGLTPQHEFSSWNAAVVCAAHGQCDHLDCRRGPFLIVFVEGSDPEGSDPLMKVYVRLLIGGWHLERADQWPSQPIISFRNASSCPCRKCALFPD